MKTIALMCAAMLIATEALAGGVDLSVGACPGNPGVSDHATLECATGKTLTLLVTFMVNEAHPDLTGLDMIFDLEVGGDMTSNANFWDFSSTNPAALGSNQARPVADCSNYFNTWAPLGSGSGTNAVLIEPSRARIFAVAYRPFGIAVLADQPLFGTQLTIDASTSLESGSGTSQGCSRPARIQVVQATPLTISADVIPPLTTPAVFGTTVVLNELATPTLRHTWGRLKSLYR